MATYNTTKTADSAHFGALSVHYVYYIVDPPRNVQAMEVLVDPEESTDDAEHNGNMLVL